MEPPSLHLRLLTLLAQLVAAFVSAIVRGLCCSSRLQVNRLATQAAAAAAVLMGVAAQKTTR